MKYIHPKGVFIYILGCFAIAFGVAMMLRSGIGMSSWDTLHYSLHKLTGITVGFATIIVATAFALFVTIYHRNLKYLFMFFPIFFVGYLIDLFNDVILLSYSPEGTILLWITFIIGILALPLGGSLLIASGYPAGVFDEAMLVFMKIFHSDKLIKIRVIMEISAVITAFLLGLLAGIGLGAIGVGTVIFSFTIGYFIKQYLKLFERIGLYETK